MVRMILVLVGLIGLISDLKGQSGSASTSIYMPLFSNVSVATESGRVTNIGQTSHLVNLQFSNAPSKFCPATQSVVASLQFSFDNLNWIYFGSPSAFNQEVSGTNQFTFFGSGAFPFVRFKLTSFDTTNCIASAWYTAASNTNDFSSSTVFTGTRVTNSVGLDSFPLISNNISPVNVVGVLSSIGTAVPVYGCIESAITPTNVAAGTFHLLSPHTALIYGICNIVATSSGVATVQLVQGVGATCTSPAALSPQFNLVAGVPLVVGSNLGLLYKVLAVNDVCLVTTGANVAFQVGWVEI